MNWTRGLLFRAWVLGSVLWLAIWIGTSRWAVRASVFSDLYCPVGSSDPLGPICRWLQKLAANTGGGLEDEGFWLMLVAPPLVLLLLGYAALWVVRGFRRPR